MDKLQLKNKIISNQSSSMMNFLTGAPRFLALAFLPLLIVQISSASQCPVNKDALLTLESKSPAEQAQIKEINQKLGVLYQQFYCVDRRTYYLQAAHVLSLPQAPEAQSAIEEFRWQHKIPASRRWAGGDSRRTQEFIELFSQYRNALPSTASAQTLKNYEIIFVTGFGNELVDDYFQDTIETLQTDFHLPKDQIHMINSDSLSGPDKSVRKLLNKYYQLRGANPDRKVLILGHSRGGLIALTAVAQNPNMVLDENLEKIITLQSPLKGTRTASTAKWLLKRVRSIVKRLPKMDSVCKRCESAEYLEQIDDGADSMRAQNTYTVMKSLTDGLSPDELARLSKKVFYISSHSNSDPSKLGTHIIPETNDGTVPLSSQTIRSFGRLIAELPDIGHTDLVVGGSKSKLYKKDRQAFARALFEQLQSPRLNIEDGM